MEGKKAWSITENELNYLLGFVGIPLIVAVFCSVVMWIELKHNKPMWGYIQLLPIFFNGAVIKSNLRRFKEMRRNRMERESE